MANTHLPPPEDSYLPSATLVLCCSTCGAEMFWAEDTGEAVICLNRKQDNKYHEREGKEENN